MNGESTGNVSFRCALFSAGCFSSLLFYISSEFVGRVVLVPSRLWEGSLRGRRGVKIKVAKR